MAAYFEQKKFRSSKIQKQNQMEIFMQLFNMNATL